MNINFLPKDLLNNLVELSKNSNVEICGFIKNNIFVKCDNLHPDPVNYFTISHKEYLKNIDSILFHSHPYKYNDKGFSDWDLENQKYHCLNMLLYSVNLNRFFYKTYDKD
jgi:proteasome lid subunit RPN8/RPN11